jgi:hypothetical protein
VTPSLLLALLITAEAPPTDADLKKKAEALVARLGHPDYRDREKAARQLLDIGYAAKDAVLAGQRSSDTEVSDRCTRLYPAIWRHNLEKRIENFLDDPEGATPDDLPGSARWLKIAGDGRSSREMYGEMLKAHSELLLDVQFHPERLRDVYTEFIRTVYTRNSVRVPGKPREQPTPSDSELLLFFFLGALDDVRPARALPGTSSTYYYQFLNSPTLGTKLSNEPMRKLYASWLEKERYSLVLRYAINTAATNEVNECAPAVLKIAADVTTTPAVRATALLGFGKLANRDDIKKLEPFLKDKLVIVNVVVNGEPWAVQIRDVALAAAVQTARQDIADFGFERRAPSGPAVTSYTFCAFANDEKREAAHQKWKDWAAANLKK